jgi:hypothetical protein
MTIVEVRTFEKMALPFVERLNPGSRDIGCGHRVYPAWLACYLVFAARLKICCKYPLEGVKVEDRMSTGTCRLLRTPSVIYDPHDAAALIGMAQEAARISSSIVPLRQKTTIFRVRTITCRNTPAI